MLSAPLEIKVNKPLRDKQVLSAVNDLPFFSAHSHDYFEIVVTIQNGFVHTVNGKALQPKNGDVVIMRPSDIHSAQPKSSGQPCKLRDIYVSKELFISVCNSLSPELYGQLMQENDGLPPSFHLSASALASLERRLSFPFFLHSDNPLPETKKRIEMLKKAIVTEILGYYIYESYIDDKKTPECIEKLMDALQDPRFRQLKIEEMASELGYAHTYLCRRFREYSGKTLQRYLICERVEKSVRMLVQTDMPIQKIAQSLGWQKVGNYNSAFKSVYGITPAKYRCNSRKK